MMKASELRIENFVGRKYLNPNPNGITHEIEPCMVKSIKEDFINVTLSLKDKCISKINISSIEPIPLTEEWRNKLGLGIDDSFLLGIDEKFYYLKLTPENNVLVYSQDYEEFTFIGEKKYVHEIQNLVHSLTGEELQVKELESDKGYKPEDTINVDLKFTITDIEACTSKIKASELNDDYLKEGKITLQQYLKNKDVIGL